MLPETFHTSHPSLNSKTLSLTSYKLHWSNLQDPKLGEAK
jgi:hypothetical protein